jgi:hypothetical protein
MVFQKLLHTVCLSTVTVRCEAQYGISGMTGFTPFVVVVGGKYFLPVPECLLFDQEFCRSRLLIFSCA